VFYGADDAAGFGVAGEGACPLAQERGLLIDRLVESLDDGPAEVGVEAAWDEEIKRRVDDIRSGRVKTIPGEQVREGLNARLRDGRQ